MRKNFGAKAILATKSARVDAPIIDELPMSHAYRVPGEIAAMTFNVGMSLK